ncbi:PHP domain-containing protein [bacterium]|nr:MAG: PHP domain-containing protein [bacterium]
MRTKFDKAYLISASDLLNHKRVPKWDFHIHTNYTDGKASVQQVFEKAIEEELEVIIFTEHTEPWRSINPHWFQSYVHEIVNFRVTYQDKIKAFIGLEANAVSFEGQVELTDQMVEKAEFVLGAAHRYPGLETRKIADLSKNEAIDLEYRTLMGLAASTEIDAIAHIGATCSKYCTPFPIHLTREIIKEATKNNVAVEINPVYHKPLIHFLEICAEENAMIALGSNAHGFGDIGLIARELEKTLKV